MTSSGTFTANALEIKFDDQVISTQSPIASNPYSFDYNAPSTGSHKITATVTDDGYYQSSVIDEEQPRRCRSPPQMPIHVNGRLWRTMQSFARQ